MAFATVMQGLLLSNRAMGILKTRRFQMDDDQKLILLSAKIFNEIASIPSGIFPKTM